MEPVEAYQNRRESQTLQELSLLEGDVHAIHLEGLLIRERILGPDNIGLRYPIRYRGAVSAESKEYEPCFALWTRAMEIAMSCDVPKTYDLEKFTVLFAIMGEEAGSVAAEGRRARFVSTTEKGVNDNIKEETARKEMSGQLRELTQQLENIQEQLRKRDRQLGDRDGQLREMTQQLTNAQRQLQEREEQLRDRDGQVREREMDNLEREMIKLAR
ncbi:protein fem-1 homolog CG6966-like [Stylophora pistillata]|uniref:protein fem-1 homolog CG6966-like n=1 Tax=Stylophora pistillata TaxID=50429 RepID=UPI000C050059|nr:protein fem-1 homolog CG6966-like [Stylophora pistillata]